jgi:ABC-type multidrug transport system ATPase subunit
VTATEVQHLVKRLGRFTAVRACRPGGHGAGPNGAGKTTTIEILGAQKASTITQA